MPRQPYPADLTDAEWAILAPLIPAPRPGGRPPRHDRRDLVDASRYVLRGGIAWRALPPEYPPWQTVYHYFRQRAGRSASPTAAMLDSQSVRTTAKGGPGAGMAPRG